MDLLDTHKLILDFWDNDNNRIHITSSSIVSQLHLRCLKMSNSAPSRLPPQEGWLGWPTLGPTLGKSCIVNILYRYPPHVNPVHFVHVPYVYCILSCAIDVSRCFVHCLCLLNKWASREIWRQPILLLPALSKTTLWNNHYGAKKAFVKLIYHFGNVTTSFSSDLMLSSNVFWREDKGILLDHWWGRSSMKNCLFLAYIRTQVEFYHSHKFNIVASPSTLKGRISHWKFIGQSLSKLLQ